MEANVCLQKLVECLKMFTDLSYKAHGNDEMCSNVHVNWPAERLWPFLFCLQEIHEHIPSRQVLARQNRFTWTRNTSAIDPIRHSRIYVINYRRLVDKLPREFWLDREKPGEAYCLLCQLAVDFPLTSTKSLQWLIYTDIALIAERERLHGLSNSFGELQNINIATVIKYLQQNSIYCM